MIHQGPIRRRRIRLTIKELEVLQLIYLGDKAIADVLGISSRAVEKYIANLKYKLNSGSRAELALVGYQLGLIQYEIPHLTRELCAELLDAVEQPGLNDA